MASEFSPEELAMYILSLTVQDPDSLPEVEIAREKPLPLNHLEAASVVKARVVEEADVVTTVETVNAMAMDVVMHIVKVDVQRIDLIKRSVTVRTIKNHAVLQVKRKQVLLFVIRAINKKKRFKMNRFFI